MSQKNIKKLTADSISILLIAFFFTSLSYRMAFPGSRYDRELSFVQLAVVFPAAFGICWILFRLLRNKSINDPSLLARAVKAGTTSLWLRAIVTVALSAIFILSLKSCALLMKII
jgi:hypothetical protein